MVVDSGDTGKQLLEKGQLKRRVTIIPLNKIASKTLDAGVIKKAKDLVSNIFLLLRTVNSSFNVDLLITRRSLIL